MDLFLALLIVNIVTFAAFFYDKMAAKQGAWRIPEANLFLLAFIGGSVSAYAGMQLFRHKTRKGKFRILVPLFMMVHIVAMGAYFTLTA